MAINKYDPPNRSISPVALDGIDHQKPFTRIELDPGRGETAQELLDKCTMYARAHLPEAIRKCVFIINNSKSDIASLKAIELIQKVARLEERNEKEVNSLGEVKDKDIEAILRSVSEEVDSD